MWRCRAGGGGIHVTSPTGYGDGNWHHVVWVYDTTLSGTSNSTRQVMYIDGVVSIASQSSVGTTSGDFTSTELPWFGPKYSTGENGAFAIDEIALFNSALSSGAVINFYNGGSPVDLSGEASLVSWWRCGEGTDTASLIYDIEGGNNMSVYSGTAVIATTDAP